ncbi:MAG: heparinase II/III-family protein [Tannerellaceae bacterium]|jgi:hypothetical protein|nr:heparinase II/III-family protein [Tannerellaceae bacterium]
MKNIRGKIIAATFILMLSVPFGAQSQWKYLPERQAVPPHPRILLKAGEEQALKNNIAADPTWAAVHQLVINEADRMLGLPELKREQIGRRLLSVSREAIRRLFYLSYACRMTDSEAYVRKAEREMLAIASFTDWNPSHFLDVAEMTMALSIGYDWLYAKLSEPTRQRVALAIFTKGIDPSMNNKNAWYKTATHNWNQVCNAGIAFGAIALMDNMPELSNSIIDAALESIQLPMKDYEPDGAYPEGFGYWDYGTSFNVMFLSAVEKLYGTDFILGKNPSFLKTGEYRLNMAGPGYKSFNYSDNGLNGGLNAAMFWFASKTKNPTLLWTEKHYLSKEIRTTDRLLPAILLWGSHIRISEVQPPENLIWTGTGVTPVALMRTSWTQPGAIYVGFKGGTASSNHAHMDAGSFVMDADGVRWASDFGMQDYNSLETKGVDLWNRSQSSDRWRVFRYNNMAHNTLTVNNALHDVQGFASLISTSGQVGFISAVAEMTPVYKGQLAAAKRGVAILDGQYVAVKDEIRTQGGQETVVRWTMLTTATVKISGRNSFELRQDGKRLKLEVAEPAKVSLKTWSTVSPNDFDAENPGTSLIGFEVSLPPSTEATLLVKLIPQSAKRTSGAVPPLSQWPK